jgi:hypothetical protein
MASDAAYARHLSTDIHAITGGGVSTLSFCISPYLSLYVHESLAKLKAIDPATSALLSSGVQQIVTRSRHSLKLCGYLSPEVEQLIRDTADEVLVAQGPDVAKHLRALVDSLEEPAVRGDTAGNTDAENYQRLEQALAETRKRGARTSS